MRLKNARWQLLLKIVILFALTAAVTFLFIKRRYIYGIIIIPVIIYILADLYTFFIRTQKEVEQFIEAIRYRDFTRLYSVKKASADVQLLRQGFNEITTLFKQISKEKETQYQYLQKILQLVEAGILCYNTADGKVIWMNDTLKKILQLPYLKTVHSLARRSKSLTQQILSIHPEEQIVANVQVQNVNFKVLLSASVFRMEESKHKLVVFQNVHETLEKAEAEAWQKLLRVLTHEIMNSIAPIASLSATLRSRLEQYSTSGNIIMEDIKPGIGIIEKRSEGLLKFAETYRTLNKISISQLKNIYVKDIFENIYRLMDPVLQQKNIALEIVLKNTDIQIQADVNLIEQVLINLILNATDSLKEKKNGKTILLAELDSDKKTVIKVIDNGSGIEEELIDKIFIPFFTTKNSGGGIGLNLCKQIMILHKGSIHVQSTIEQGTVFTLKFH